MFYFCIDQGKNIPAYELDLMYKMRHKVGVLDWNWSLPNKNLGRDKDQFDRPDTTYLLVYNSEDVLVACARLNPTTSPHLMSEIFPHQCDFQGVPQGSDIMELSRFMVDEDHLTHFEKVQLYLQICLAITKYSVSIGITQLTWLSHTARYTKSVVVWRTRPLGTPLFYKDDSQEYIAAIMEVNAEAVARLQRFIRTDWTEPLKQIPTRKKQRAA